MIKKPEKKRKTGRLFICIGKIEKLKRTGWSETVDLNSVYLEYEGSENENELYLKTSEKTPFYRYVDANQFKEIFVYQAKHMKDLKEGLAEGKIMEVKNTAAMKALSSLDVQTKVKTTENKYNEGFTAFEIIN